MTMTGIGTKTVTVGAEFERLNRRADELAGQLRDAEAGTQSGQAIQRMATAVDEQGRGVAYLVEEYGRDATVTVRGLDAGLYARLDDRAADLRAMRDGPGDAPGSVRNATAATGLVEAPFFDPPTDGEPGGRDYYEAALDALAGSGLPSGVAKWLESLVNDATGDASGNWTPFSERLLATSED